MSDSNFQYASGRPVITPQGQYPSVREAAKALGLNRKTIKAKCERQSGGFHYKDDPPLPPAPCVICKAPAQRLAKKGEYFCLDHSQATARAAFLRYSIIHARGCLCTSCHQVLPPFALDFHHTDHTAKSFGMSVADIERVLRRGSYSLASQAVYKEAEKCVLVCSNCHRIDHSSDACWFYWGSAIKVLGPPPPVSEVYFEKPAAPF